MIFSWDTWKCVNCELVPGKKAELDFLVFHNKNKRQALQCLRGILISWMVMNLEAIIIIFLPLGKNQ